VRGNVLAFTSITVGAGLTVDGRMMAINGAVTMDTDTIARASCAPGGLSITVPAPADLGGGAPGGTVLSRLGSVTVTDRREPAPAGWVVTVIASNFVMSGSPAQTVTPVNVSYWSGQPTSITGTGTFTTGQATASQAQTIDVERVAFTLSGAGGVNSATWRPTVTVQLPLSAVAGTYTGTVTFSVA
jgi:hypothetical protein